jgi:hypothetical protein
VVLIRLLAYVTLQEHYLTLHHVGTFAAYLVVADEKFGRQVPFVFLDKVKAEFSEKYAESSRTLHAHSLDRTFGYVNSIIQRSMQTP